MIEIHVVSDITKLCIFCAHRFDDNVAICILDHDAYNPDTNRPKNYVIYTNAAHAKITTLYRKLPVSPLNVLHVRINYMCRPCTSNCDVLVRITYLI